MHLILDFCFTRSGHHRYLHSFPTRRSSDLWLLIQIPIIVIRIFKFLPVMKTIISMLCRLHLKPMILDRKSTRLNSSHVSISYAVFCLKKKKKNKKRHRTATYEANNKYASTN